MFCNPPHPVPPPQGGRGRWGSGAALVVAVRSRRGHRLKKRVGILISGRGSNMMALVQAARTAAYPAEIAAVISNVPDAAGLAWAKAQGVPSGAIR